MMWLRVVLGCALVALVAAECPGGCSGNGACEPRDTCKCYKNYQGNDCAERTCPFGYAHVDTPKGDINMDRNTQTAGVILDGSQVYPHGTYEYFPPINVASTGEAHFYMECSNQGICDRASGLCQCFDGYDGGACQRTACPNKCSGHGTCESIREMGHLNDRIAGVIPKDFQELEYDMWDARTNYGCLCDPWFTGPDCSLRKCKVGIDPLYEADGFPVYDSFAIILHVTADSTATPPEYVEGTFQLRMFDYFGESYVTTELTYSSDTDTPAALVSRIQTAIRALPNVAFEDVICLKLDELGTFADRDDPITSGHDGVTTVCRYASQPGSMRLPEFVKFNIAAVARPGGSDPDYNILVLDQDTTKAAANFIIEITSFMFRGEESDSFKKTALTVSTITTPDEVEFAGDATVLPFTAPALVKIKDQYLIATSKNTIGAATTIEFELPGLVYPIADVLGFYLYETAYTVTALTPTVNVARGSTAWTFSATVAAVLNVGDMVMVENTMYTVLTRDAAAVTVDRPFFGTKAAAPTALKAYRVQGDEDDAFEYVSECSGRGLCGRDSGLCTCFKGYTGDNCDTQNILSM